MDWDRKFKAEYDYARGWLSQSELFEKSWQPLVKQLYKLMSDGGFDPVRAGALSDLRDKVHADGKKSTEDKPLLRAVGAWTDDGGGAVEATAKMRAAALKLLRHTYLLNRWGNRKVWIVSLPKTFTDWPSDDLSARAATQIAARILLRAHDEIFSAEQKKHLAHSTREALAWAHRTSMVLAHAASASDRGGSKNVEALNVVKRWFADPSVDVGTLNGWVARLKSGFKDITATLNKGHFVLTDWVPLRGASTQEEIDFLNSEAFTFASFGEGMDTVYIERSFFTDDPGGVVHGQKNWTRVIVHELTHLVCGTEDVQNGRARYAWYGIGPHAGYPGTDAIRNADNWAFFSADCAGVLTDSERNKALKII